MTKVRESGFCVLASDGAEFWLNRECVFTVESERVTLICEREGLQAYVVPTPPDA